MRRVRFKKSGLHYCIKEIFWTPPRVSCTSHLICLTISLPTPERVPVVAEVTLLENGHRTCYVDKQCKLKCVFGHPCTSTPKRKLELAALNGPPAWYYGTHWGEEVWRVNWVRQRFCPCRITPHLWCGSGFFSSWLFWTWSIKVCIYGSILLASLSSIHSSSWGYEMAWSSGDLACLDNESATEFSLLGM